MLKILQARIQQYKNQELPDVQGGFRKGRGTRDQIVNIHYHRNSKGTKKKTNKKQKTTSALLNTLKSSLEGLMLKLKLQYCGHLI